MRPFNFKECTIMGYLPHDPSSQILTRGRRQRSIALTWLLPPAPPSAPRSAHAGRGHPASGARRGDPLNETRARAKQPHSLVRVVPMGTESEGLGHHWCAQKQQFWPPLLGRCHNKSPYSLALRFEYKSSGEFAFGACHRIFLHRIRRRTRNRHHSPCSGTRSNPHGRTGL